MNKILSTLLFIFSFTFAKAQVELIPDSVYFVMEMDLGKIVKSISLEEIDKLEFVKDILSELNEGADKTMKVSELGIDFNSKLVAYTAERESHSNTTIIIPIKDQNSFIALFDELDQLELKKNNILIKDRLIISLNKNNCIISNIEWKQSYFADKTEALYNEKGWELPNNFYFMYGYEYGDAYYDDEDYYEEEIYYDEDVYLEEAGEVEDAVDDEHEVDEYEEDDESDDIILDYENEYYTDADQENQEELETRLLEVMDSIKAVEKNQLIAKNLDFLKNPTHNLLSNDPVFKKVSSQIADAKIYYNPSLNPDLSEEFYYMPFGRFIHEEFNEFRQYAYMNFSPQGIQVDWKIKSSDKFGKVFNKAATGKLNKELLKHIPDYAQGFGVYNVNTFGAYQQLKETYLPILDASDDGRELLAGAIWSTIDEFINMEAMTSIYPPQLLFSYGGLKEVELPKVTYDYDEETFQYTEVDTSYMEKIPMVNFVMANERAYLLEKYIKAIMKLQEGIIVNSGNYYTVLDDPLGLGIPYYIAIRNDIILITNDEDAVRNNMNGYTKKAFHKSVYKKAKKSKLFYAHLDLTQINTDLAGLYGGSEVILNRFEDKAAKVDFEMTSVEKNQINFSIKMMTNEKYKNGAQFLFDFINEVYLINNRR